MANLFVCYTVVNPNPNLAILLDGMNGIRVWQTSTSSAWLVRSEGSAEFLRDKLAPYVGEGGNLLVCGFIDDVSCQVQVHRNPISEYQKRFPN
jgi:hypothetical protein